jgi:DNA-binding CsgD family transcriptional regulator
VIAIDDVHWADPLTLFALRVLPGRLAASPVAWVLSSRPAPAEAIGGVLTAAEETLTVTRLPLGPLSAEALAELAHDRLGTEPAPPIRELLGRVGGNPFWAVQVIDGLTWRQRQGLDQRDMHAELIRHVQRRMRPLDPEVAELGAERNPGVRSLLGVAQQTRGLVERDPGRLAEAVETFRAGPRPMLLAWALGDHAALAREAGDRATADSRLKEAVTLLEEIGAAPDALADPRLRVAFDARRTRGPKRAAHGRESLTDAERRVAELVSAGHSNRSTAAEIGISPNTVSTHLRAVYSKLGVSSRVQLSNQLREP